MELPSTLFVSGISSFTFPSIRDRLAIGGEQAEREIHSVTNPMGKERFILLQI